MSHDLVELSHVADLMEAGQNVYGNNYLVDGVAGFPRAILKFKAVTICEVFGYQIAHALGVHVPRAQGFFSDEAVETRYMSSDRGRIGILVEYYADWRDLSWENAKRLDRATVARAVAFEVFNRDEWGHFGLARGRVYFIDHERLLPLMQPEVLIPLSWEERVETLRVSGEWYNGQDFGRINDVFAEAEAQDVVSEVERALRDLASLRPESYRWTVRITGHPVDELLSRFAAHTFGRRVNAVAEILGCATHEVPVWP